MPKDTQLLCDGAGTGTQVLGSTAYTPNCYTLGSPRHLIASLSGSPWIPYGNPFPICSHQPWMGWAWKDRSFFQISHQVWAALWTLSTKSLNVCLLGDPSIPTASFLPTLLILTTSITTCLFYVQISPNSQIHTSNCLLDIST